MADQGSETAPAPQPESAERTLAQQVAENEQQIREQSQKYLEEIEEEVRQNQPLVSPKEEIATLVQSYDVDTSPAYYIKAAELGEIYSHIRRIRGDGNCFYRAVLTAELEYCYNNADELNKFTTLCRGWRERLVKDHGFPDLTTGDFCDAMDTLLDSIKNRTTTEEMLFHNLNETVANYYVAFLRLITSGYLREHEAEYAGFIEGGRTIDQFCKDEIEPMWKECDHICIIALVNAMGVSIRVEYMDQTQAPNGGWHYDISADSSAPKLFFLYRPGHYDLLYKRA
ncbi:Protein OTUB-1 [Aphelenchoides avenae]|nr:Protein OTUB-1 [Aphelenchus avenae]KAH7730414.1 Protein OTUB-1 [Aphelenchus avenae]